MTQILDFFRPNTKLEIPPIQAPVPIYSPPVDWVNISTVLPNQINILACDAGSAKLGFLVTTVGSGGYHVDWGDGTTNDYLHNQVASHTYVKNTGMLCSRGYSTFKAVVSALTEISTFNIKAPPSIKNRFDNRILGVVFGTNNISSFSESFRNPVDPYISVNLLEFVIMPAIYNGSSFLNTFSNLISLQSVTMPITYGSNYTLEKTFFNCYQLFEVKNSEYLLGNGVTTMLNTFANCYSLQSMSFGVDLPNCTTIESAFSGCWNLRSVVMPTTMPLLTNMTSVFSTCNVLEKVKLPLSLPSLSNMSYAFSNCYALTSVNFPAISVGYLNCTRIFESCKSLEHQVIPDGLPCNLNLNYAYRLCNSLKEINFPTQNIGNLDATFYSCKSLRTAVFAPILENLTTMSQAFYDCPSLLTVQLPNNCTALTTLSNAFSSCISLISCTLPNAPNCTSLSSVFFGCGALQSVIIPFPLPKVTSMSAAFASCFSLQEVIGLSTVGGQVTACDYSSFGENCEQLVSVAISSRTQNIAIYGSIGKPNNLTSLILTIPSNSFSTGSGVVFNISFTMLDRAAIVAVFNALPTVTSKTINITSSIGVADLTVNDRLIATSKGWTISG